MSTPTEACTRGMLETSGRVLDCTPSDLKVVESTQRLYSTVWQIEHVDPAVSRRFVVKSWTDERVFALQLAVLERARTVFESDADVYIPYVGYDANSRILVMEYVPDPALERLLHFPPGLAGINLIGWRTRLSDACFTAGRWLRDWHTIDVGDVALSESLGRYLYNRRRYLELIDSSTRRRIERLVDRQEREAGAAVHGDFTPPNILWSRGTLTVLDFGVSEWQCMTPAWDYETMRAGLERELLFSTRSPAHWITALARSPIEAFERGYGVVNASKQALYATRAVRQLILYGNDRSAGRALQKRAAWHHRKLVATIDTAERDNAMFA